MCMCVYVCLSSKFFLFSVQLTLIQETMSSMQSEEDEALSVSVSMSVCLSHTERISILFALQLSLIQKTMSIHPWGRTSWRWWWRAKDCIPHFLEQQHWGRSRCLGLEPLQQGPHLPGEMMPAAWTQKAPSSSPWHQQIYPGDLVCPMLLPFVKTTRQNFFSPSLLSLTQCVGRGWNSTPPPPQPQFCYPETATQPPKSGKTPAIPFFFRTSQIFSAPPPPPPPPLTDSSNPPLSALLYQILCASFSQFLLCALLSQILFCVLFSQILLCGLVVPCFLRSITHMILPSFPKLPNCVMSLCDRAIEDRSLPGFFSLLFLLLLLLHCCVNCLHHCRLRSLRVCLCVCVRAFLQFLKVFPEFPRFFPNSFLHSATKTIQRLQIELSLGFSHG